MRAGGGGEIGAVFNGNESYDEEDRYHPHPPHLETHCLQYQGGWPWMGSKAYAVHWGQGSVYADSAESGDDEEYCGIFDDEDGTDFRRSDFELSEEGKKCMTAYLKGGIYMASTVANTTEVWDAKIDSDDIGEHGDVEHLRKEMTNRGVGKVCLAANELCWMTDRTPHESLPMPVGTRRQYFRLVAGPVSVWFSEHSTVNPDSRYKPEAQIIHGNKFAKAVQKREEMEKRRKEAARPRKLENRLWKLCVCSCMGGEDRCIVRWGLSNECQFSPEIEDEKAEICQELASLGWTMEATVAGLCKQHWQGSVSGEEGGEAPQG